MFLVISTTTTSNNKFTSIESKRANMPGQGYDEQKMTAFKLLF